MASNTPALLDTLDAAIVDNLLPFFAKLAAQHLVGESSYTGYPGVSSLISRRHEDLDGRFFWWINRFIVDDTTFDVAYGDKEFLIETKLFYAGIRDRFAPWEILSAAQVDEPLVVSGETWVLSPDFITRVISRISNGIRQHWDILHKPTPKIIDRALVLRGKRMIFAQEEQRHQDRKRAEIKVSTAFHAGNYAKAKQLLLPFKDDVELTPASIKILEIIKKKLK